MVDFDALKERLKAQGLDFDAIGKEKGVPIERPILPLLYILNICGYKTEVSCAGHTREEFLADVARSVQRQPDKEHIIGENEHQYMLHVIEKGPVPLLEADKHHLLLKGNRPRGTYTPMSKIPFVDMKLMPAEQELLESRIREYNAADGVQWRIAPAYYEGWRRLTTHPCPLPAARESIPSLAEFLYERR